MQRMVGLAAFLAVFAAFPATADDEAIHRARWRSVDLRGPVIEDLVHPEGKTRWELGSAVLTGNWIRTIVETDAGGLSVSETRRIPSESVVYSADAFDWWMPHLADALYGEPLIYEETVRANRSRVWVRTKNLGTGWVFLPSGPRQATLQRSFVKRAKGQDGSFQPDRVIYRWVDPRAGAVAEIWGRPGFDGSTIVEFEGARMIDEVIQGGLPLRIYRDEIQAANGERLMLGFDRMGTCTLGANSCVKNADCTAAGDDRCTIPIAQVATGSPAAMSDLLAQASWDFSPNQLANSRYEIASSQVAIGSTETCSNTQCGFAGSANMGREDKNFNNFTEPGRQDLFMTFSAIEGEDRGTDYTIWLRGGVRHEGVTTGALGESESRFCYDGNDSFGDPRPEVPLWRFPHNDGEYYMQVGDSWANNTVFGCEQSVFNHSCPNSCGVLCQLSIAGCSTEPGEGQQASVVLDEGPITLPSGHTMDALLIRQVVDFCNYLFHNCSSGDGVAQVRQAIYLWVVPNLGTVARLMSEQKETDVTTFTDLQETDIKYGLLPPRSISTSGQTDTTIDISWDPGTITHHIDGYKVYWNTASGSGSPYAFDSVNNAGQVNIVGTTATISGLTAGTDYFITVTALFDYANPSSGVTNTYESLLYPRTTGGSAPLPPELVAMTTGGSCIPTQEITGVTVNKDPGGVEICWTASTDPCVTGYEIYRAASPESAGNYSSSVPDTGPVTCHTYNPPDGYFLVIGNGTGGDGPWGHYGM